MFAAQILHFLGISNFSGSFLIEVWKPICGLCGFWIKFCAVKHFMRCNSFWFKSWTGCNNHFKPSSMYPFLLTYAEQLLVWNFVFWKNGHSQRVYVKFHSEMTIPQWKMHWLHSFVYFKLIESFLFALQRANELLMQSRLLCASKETKELHLEHISTETVWYSKEATAYLLYAKISCISWLSRWNFIQEDSVNIFTSIQVYMENKQHESQVEWILILFSVKYVQKLFQIHYLLRFWVRYS